MKRVEVSRDHSHPELGMSIYDKWHETSWILVQNIVSKDEAIILGVSEQIL